MQPDNSFVALMEQLRNGDQDAARRVYSTFAHRLIALARQRLDGGILQKEGPEDIVQSALASFFRRHSNDPFELASWDNLWALLTVITLRKCGHRVEHYLALCRDIRRETSTAGGTEDSAGSWLALGREPEPAEVVALEDTIRELLRGMDEREREIVRMTLEGYSVPEISPRVHRSEYLVRKVIDRVRDRWRRLC